MDRAIVGAAFLLPGADPIWSEPESAPGPLTSGAFARAAQKKWSLHNTGSSSSRNRNPGTIQIVRIGTANTGFYLRYPQTRSKNTKSVVSNA